jgi:U3 small nucleolar RNA-associated protein 25
MRAILGPNTTVSNGERFVEEYGADDESEPQPRKPQDWRDLFEGQNVDDDFKLGIQVNPGHGKGSGMDKGVYLRLFADFYLSDIVIASPLGIRLLIENKGKAERDFMSSLEVIYISQADVLYFQNWEHVDFVMRHANQLPINDRGTDFSRIRPYFLDQKSHQYRQLVLSTALNLPVIQATFREFGTSLSNKIRLKSEAGEGSISDVLSKVKQVFQLIPCDSLPNEDEDRFTYFVKNVMTPILRMKQNRTLIVTPSYLDYIKIRNYLMEQQADAAFISEYSRDSEISRGRSRFFQGKHQLLVYSGRAHFFRRFALRGAMHIVFYSLPERPDFYSEMVNFLAEASNAGLEADMSCIALFTRYDQMLLEKIVGKKRSIHMLGSGQNTFVFK